MRRLNRALLRKLTQLPPGEWLELLRAQASLVHAQVLVWTRARGRLVAPASKSCAFDRWSQEPGATAVEPGVQRIALAIERAAAYGLFRPNCLVRALALHQLLAGKGFRGSAVHAGARLEGGRFIAHAWVEYKGHVLGDPDWRVKKFAELGPMKLQEPS